MSYFIARRLAGFLLTLWAVSVVVFAVMNVLPGDPALTILGIDSTEEARAALRARLGLDQPVILRYLDWVAGALRGDFGESYSFGVPVSGLIAERLPLTFSLALSGMVVTVLLALVLGITAAAAPWPTGRLGDHASEPDGHRDPGLLAVDASGSLVRGQAALAAAGWLSRLGRSGSRRCARWCVPTAALALVQSAVLARVTRSAALEVMRLDFVRTARATGFGSRHVLWRHVLPNALVPIVTIVGLQFAGLVTGTIVIENVFYLPGLGRLLFQSIANRDLITVQALVMLFAALVVTANFLVDIAYVVIDPRLREARG